MNCYSCKHQFCWSCLGSYYGYRHTQVDNGAICGVRELFLIGFAQICLFSALMKIYAALMKDTESFDSFLQSKTVAILYCLQTTVVRVVWFVFYVVFYLALAFSMVGTAIFANPRLCRRSIGFRLIAAYLCAVYYLLGVYGVVIWAVIYACAVAIEHKLKDTMLWRRRR